jgi:hypothetical protein
MEFGFRWHGIRINSERTKYQPMALALAVSPQAMPCRKCQVKTDLTEQGARDPKGRPRLRRDRLMFRFASKRDIWDI